MTTDAVGGVWQYSVDLARGLAGLGIETVLAVLGPSPTKAQVRAFNAIAGATLVDTGLPLDWLAEDRLAVRHAGEKVAMLAATHSASLVQLNTPALAAETRFDVPVVGVVHSCLATWWQAVKGTRIDGGYQWRATVTEEGLRSADMLVAPSVAFAEAVRQAYNLPRAPIAVHNGRTALPLPRVAPHDFAFTAGRLWDKAKNVRTLEAAAGRLAVPFYAAGPVRGPSGDTVDLEHVRSLGVIGERELARWLAARPVFASAAVYEPFGLSVLEAAAAGCPLVLSDIPTFRELWDGAAIFVPPMDEERFAAAIGEIVADGALRSELGASARERAGRYTPAAMAANMAGIYRDALAGPAKQPEGAKAAA